MTRILKGDVEKRELRGHLRSEMTRAENRLWLQLRSKQFHSLKFRRQHGIGPYIVDFYCPEKAMVIEVDGDVHGLEEQVLKDRNREQELQSLGVQVIRYTNDDVLNNVEGVLEDLGHRLLSGSTSPHPSPFGFAQGTLQRRGRGGSEG